MGKINAVFIHIPKTAGSYIIRVLNLLDCSLPRRNKGFPQAGHVTFGHQDYLKLVNRGKVSKEFDETAFKFASCRNPYDRVISHYFYTRKRHPDILPIDVSFLDFTRSLGKLKTPGRLYGRVAGKYFFRKQIEPIRNIEIDFIIRFEDLKKDVRNVAKIIGVNKLLRSHRVRISRHKPYWEYYDKESVVNVQEFYKEDFEFFGYDINDNRLLHLL